MRNGNLAVLVIGILIGGLAVWWLKPAAAEAPEGRFIVIEHDTGHVIYAKEGFDVTEVAREDNVGAYREGFEALRSFPPELFEMDGSSVLLIPHATWKGETHNLDVDHEFFRLVDGKLVQMEIQKLEDED